MFIAGLIIGPALAVGLGDVLFDASRISVKWLLIGVAALLVLVIVIPFFPAELKFGLLISVPVGLLVAAPQRGEPETERSTHPA
jgi:uncharacterized protein HemY